MADPDDLNPSRDTGDPRRIDLRFASGDTQCSAWLYLPAGAGPHPVIVLGHGLGAVKAMRLDAFAQRFRGAGYACFVFDYRHFGDSGGEPRQLLDIDRQLEDWAAAIAACRGRPELDPRRVVLWGSSFGGGHVIIAAARDGQVAAAISQCPFTDGIASSRVVSPQSLLKLGALGLRDLAGSYLGKPPVMVALAGPEHSTALMTAPDAMDGYLALVPPGMPFRNEVAARFALRIGTHRPGKFASQVQCPVLFCLCDRDTVAPADVAQRYARQAPRGEIRHYDVGHFDIYLGDAFERAVTDQLEFLTRHVPTGEAQATADATATDA